MIRLKTKSKPNVKPVFEEKPKRKPQFIVSVALPEDVYDKIDTLANSAGETRSSIVRKIIDKYIQEAPKKAAKTIKKK